MFKKIDILIIIINIIFFSYYSIQLLLFTDEFAINNLGFFNHAVAGLSEVLGIIFITFIIGFVIIIFRDFRKQLPFLLSIFIFQLLAALNFWRYIFTNSPGETSVNIITSNAIIFSIMVLFNLLLLGKNFTKL
tara:strand:+ start:697 stop:1095 length:399 start_codon:yes stop_codon:yes gene_type:complete